MSNAAEQIGEVRRFIGVLALINTACLAIPWSLISVLLAEGLASAMDFGHALEMWANQFIDNIFKILLAATVAILILGQDAARALFRGGSQPPPRF